MLMNTVARRHVFPSQSPLEKIKRGKSNFGLKMVKEGKNDRITGCSGNEGKEEERMLFDKKSMTAFIQRIARGPS